MSIWLAAAMALLPPLAVAVWGAAALPLADRLVSVALASAIAGQAMIMLSFAFDQNSTLDVPVTLAFLSLPGTLLLAIFLERWI